MRQHLTDDTGTEYPVYTKLLGALRPYAVRKSVREFLRTVTMTLYISQEYSLRHRGPVAPRLWSLLHAPFFHRQCGMVRIRRDPRMIRAV
jgi:hypothetical protein